MRSRNSTGISRLRVEKNPRPRRYCSFGRIVHRLWRRSRGFRTPRQTRTSNEHVLGYLSSLWMSHFPVHLGANFAFHSFSLIRRQAAGVLLLMPRYYTLKWRRPDTINFFALPTASTLKKRKDNGNICLFVRSPEYKLWWNSFFCVVPSLYFVLKKRLAAFVLDWKHLIVSIQYVNKTSRR